MDTKEKEKFGFSFAQIGIITLMFQMTSSILQPFTGLYADKTSIEFIFQVSAFLPLLGITAGFLPNTQVTSIDEKHNKT